LKREAFTELNGERKVLEFLFLTSNDWSHGQRPIGPEKLRTNEKEENNFLSSIYKYLLLGVYVETA